jgi:UDP-N-acetylglucosamine--N-acetylmuramyl-(pentapeptide) pyrophosphoryl-undecaprenol N-acetylglucosamine transferase
MYLGKRKRILFTGGGSAGHVTVNVALIPQFLDMGWDVKYMGSVQGIESGLIQKFQEVEYLSISTGKLRRYLDWQNVKDPFRVVKGAFQAYKHIRKIKPDVVFSKGGFVSVPVILGAWLNRVPIVLHESDLTPGLANRISIPMASKICVTFPETKAHVKQSKAVHVGAVIRDELLLGSAVRGLNCCNFTRSKPVIVFMGGSLGSRVLNESLRRNLLRLIETYQIVHICGKGQLNSTLSTHREYRQFEYIHEQLPDILAMADMVVTRAGSNSIFEFLALRKPMLLIPLSKESSRGDQILNAESFRAAGYAEVLHEADITDELFIKSIHSVFEHRQAMIEKMQSIDNNNAVSQVVELIKAITKQREKYGDNFDER